jgi:hypothetical protein
MVPEQHPFGHEVPSHTHAPPTQRWPTEQGAPPPHWQLPVAEHRSAVIPQLVHAPPFAPQLPTACALQVVPEQHPVGHDVPSHTQLPCAQRWPAPQAGPAPQPQLPVAEQLSAVMTLHATHARPADPQLVSDGGVTQVVPLQQPLGHDVPSQTQAPATQRWPVPHIGPPPHEQLPPLVQRSALLASQPTQVVAPMPQVVSEGWLQVAPEQHPLGQLVALQPLHRPAVQVCPAGQRSQTLPPAPQDVTLLPVRQAPPEQHPVGQDVPSQTQVLPMQRWPASHAGLIPQRQAPIEEQLSARVSHMAQVDPASPQVGKDRAAQVVP